MVTLFYPQVNKLILKKAPIYNLFCQIRIFLGKKSRKLLGGKNQKSIINILGVTTGIDPSLLTSAAFELVQASQALQAVQAVPPLIHPDSPPMMTPLTQVIRMFDNIKYFCNGNMQLSEIQT